MHMHANHVHVQLLEEWLILMTLCMHALFPSSKSNYTHTHVIKSASLCVSINLLGALTDVHLSVGVCSGVQHKEVKPRSGRSAHCSEWAWVHGGWEMGQG